MSDNSGSGGFVLLSLSGCYAEVHISWENLIWNLELGIMFYYTLALTLTLTLTMKPKADR